MMSQFTTITQAKLVDVLLAAYSLGADCVKAVNSKRGWTPAAARRERAALDAILRDCGLPKITDEQYEDFCH